MESTKQCVSLLLPISEKLSKFSQNHKFREVFSKRGTSFFRGGCKILNLQGQNLFRGQAGSGGTFLPPCGRKPALHIRLSKWFSSNDAHSQLKLVSNEIVSSLFQIQSSDWVEMWK